MIPRVVVTCPTDGDQRVPADVVIVDLERRIVAFTCPRCHDLVRHRCTGDPVELLERTIRCGAAVGDLGPVRRPDVCDGQPLTSIEAFRLHCELSTLSGLA